MYYFFAFFYFYFVDPDSFIFSAVLPYITPFDFESEANTGEGVQVSCYVSKGDLPVGIVWTLNGKPISLHSGISMIPIGGRTSLITISSVEADHAGEYQCTASNQAGSSSHSTTLFVNGIFFITLSFQFILMLSFILRTVFSSSTNFTL